MTTYTLIQIENLLEKYKANGGTVYTITGSLLDNYICILDGHKTAIIKEKYLNCWSSTYTITLYNKTPKKYLSVIDHLDNDNYTQAEKLFWR